jgi:hypothetical protein
MTITQYFTLMPIIAYANTNVRNITKRSTVVHSRLLDANDFYPLELQNGLAGRADVVADALYGDSYLDWSFWLNNNIVDPYYQWQLSDDEFQTHINDVYGSVPVAEQTIAYWRTAWPDGVVKIPVSDFLYNIPAAWKPYYQPIYDNNGNIMYYAQAYLNWRMNTNQILEWTVEMTEANTVFAVGNVVQVVVGGNVTGSGQVVESNSTIVIVQHTQGNTGPPGGLQDMFNTNITATFTNTNIIQTNIGDDIDVFWEPVSNYTLEEERNAYRHFISVVDPTVVLQMITLMSAEFQE